VGWFRGRRDRRERELERELHDHLELEAEDRGDDPDAARRALGNTLLIREHTRTEWPWMRAVAWFEHLWHDVRHGVRVLTKAPGFTIVAVLSIACGTGANVAMFSVADALLLRPLPVPRPDELLAIGSQPEAGPWTAMSYPDYADLREQSRSFEGMLAFLERPAGVGISSEAPPLVRIVTLASANYLDVLGLQPAVGRWFRPDEDEVPGRDAVAVLSHGLWQERYEGDPAVVGRTVRINGVEFTVIGVAPAGFTGLSTRGIAESVYVPFAMTRSLGVIGFQDVLSNRARRWLGVRGRLRPGVGLDEARADLAVIGRNLARAYPDSNADAPIVAQTELETRLAYSSLDNGLLLLLAILSTAVLGVACANVAGLLASRAPLRAREISLRLAIGAGRGRVVRQLVTESLLLALAGGVSGLAVALATIDAFRQVRFPTDMVQVPTFQLDGRALAFSLAVAMGSAFLFGVGPALHTTRLDLAGAIRSTGDPGSRWWRPGSRGTLVAVQVALSLVLVTLAVFVVQTFGGVVATGPGFHTTRMAKITLDTQHRRYRLDETATFIERALEGARQLPGVTAVAATSTMPLFHVTTDLHLRHRAAPGRRLRPVPPAAARARHAAGSYDWRLGRRGGGVAGGRAHAGRGDARLRRTDHGDLLRGTRDRHPDRRRRGRRRHGNDGRAGDPGGPLLARRVLGEAAHPRDRHPDGHRCQCRPRAPDDPAAGHAPGLARAGGRCGAQPRRRAAAPRVPPHGRPVRAADLSRRRADAPGAHAAGLVRAGAKRGAGRSRPGSAHRLRPVRPARG
jgi:hypothetical protein